MKAAAAAAVPADEGSRADREHVECSPPEVDWPCPAEPEEEQGDADDTADFRWAAAGQFFLLGEVLIWLGWGWIERQRERRIDGPRVVHPNHKLDEGIALGGFLETPKQHERFFVISSQVPSFLTFFVF